MSKNSKSKKRLVVISVITPFCVKECRDNIDSCLRGFEHPAIEVIVKEVVQEATRLQDGKMITLITVTGDSRDSCWSKSGMGELCNRLEKTGYHIQGINSAVYSFIPA